MMACAVCVCVCDNGVISGYPYTLPWHVETQMDPSNQVDQLRISSGIMPLGHTSRQNFGYYPEILYKSHNYINLC